MDGSYMGDMKKKVKRIMAWIGICLLLAIYLLMLIFALMKTENWFSYFLVAMVATIVVPIIMWINMFLYDRIIGDKKQSEVEE
jgi:membrane protein YdbS with pleckstrin-like domain